MEELRGKIKKLEDKVSIEEKKNFPNIDLIISWNNNLTALQQERNILLRRESQGNLY